MRALLSSVLAAAIAVAVGRQDPEQPPPLRMTVTVGGVAHQVVDGVEQVVDVAGAPTKLRVDVAPLRRFAAGGVAFDFPRDMVFEFEDSGVLQIWTLEGSDLTVMVQRIKLGTADEFVTETLTQMAANFAEVLNDEPQKPEPCVVAAGGVDRPAQRVRFTIAEHPMTNTAFGIDLGKGKGCVMVMLQDSCGEDGAPSAEHEAFLQLLATSFELTAQARPKSKPKPEAGGR